MPKLTIGRFSLEDGTLEGPAEYMRERGDARVEKILAGEDVVCNTGVAMGSSVERAILVSLQTDYAGWLGQKQAEGWLAAKR